MFPPRLIVVPVDFGPASRTALALATHLARVTNAELVVLHVFALPPGGLGDVAARMSREASARIISDAREGVAAMIASLDRAGVRPRVVLEEGDPRTAIGELAAREHADLVVLGTHAREGLARLLIGSTAEAVLRTSPVPVLTVRATGSAAPAAETASTPSAVST